MSQVLLISLGGAIGTAVRYLTAVLAIRWLGADFPYGTLAVNLAGAFLIGLVQEVASTTLMVPEPMRLFVVTGILGGMTTYSAFAYETVHLAALGTWGRAGTNVLVTNVCCLVFCWLGIAVARTMVGRTP
jgi:fluoride exporter